MNSIFTLLPAFKFSQPFFHPGAKLLGSFAVGEGLPQSANLFLFAELVTRHFQTPKKLHFEFSQPLFHPGTKLTRHFQTPKKLRSVVDCETRNSAVTVFAQDCGLSFPVQVAAICEKESSTV